MKNAESRTLLILMRHAKSSWADESVSDHDRPLNSRGISSTPLIARWLADHQIEPDQILCSSALRTQQTAEILLRLAPTLKNAPTSVSKPPPAPVLLTVPNLYLATPKTIVESIRHNASRTARTILVLGHNPGMEILVSTLSNEFIEMPTASLAVFSASEKDWSSFLSDGLKESNSIFHREHFIRPRDLTPN